MSAKVCPVCFEETPRVLETRCVADKALSAWSVIRRYECPRGHRATTTEIVAAKKDERGPAQR